MKRILSLSLIIFSCFSSFAQNGIYTPEMTNCDNLVNQFMNQFGIPGATFAMAKDGRLVYMRSFGNADLAGAEPTQPYHMFRIMSVSKSVTGIAVMKLVESGQINLSDKVFGTGGIMENNTYFNNVNITDNRIYDITVQHLLEHSGGFNSSISCTPSPASPYTWNVGHCDPIGFPLHVTETLGESNPVTKRAYVKFLLEKGLNFDPGTQYSYSNIGFLLVGLVIEEITGLTYENYVKQEILHPLGIYDMHNAKSWLSEKYEREGEYHGGGQIIPSILGDGSNQTWEYGGSNIEAMDAHGGWIASARDLLRLLVAVDGFSTKPDILSSASVNTMITPSATSANYAKGWSVNQFNNWWHTGAYAGTASMWARTGNGYTWVIILNKRIEGANGTAFWTALDNLPWTCISQTSNWPTNDLFDSPLENASQLKLWQNNSTSMKITWENGDGEKRIVIASENPVSSFPLDGVNYSADATFGMGDDIGNGNFVIYNGNGTEVIVEGLDSTKTYHFRVFEYNQNTTTGNHALYFLANSPQDSASVLTATNLEHLKALGVKIYPNPATDLINIEVPENLRVSRIEIRNIHGQIVRQEQISQSKVVVSLVELPSQVYLLSLFGKNGMLGNMRILKK
ncbi:MAG: serine hydrolase [Bacteroidetes bacterium]|nr:serine hydrolase [Bacteroidota bacterium]